jgi:5-methylcytosine-specific restriction endonuclease McrA
VRDPALMREYMRRYRERNHERVLARERERYHLNPEKYRDKSKRVRRKRSPEYSKTLRRIQYHKHNEREKQDPAYQKDWRKRNRSHLLQYQRAYAEQNRQKINDRARRWIQKNLQRHRANARKSKQNRRAREVEAVGQFTVKDIELLHVRQRGRCYWCKAGYGEKFHIDHVWPLKRGGSNGPENIVLSCPTCNVRKNARTPLDFAGRLL